MSELWTHRDGSSFNPFGVICGPSQPGRTFPGAALGLRKGARGSRGESDPGVRGPKPMRPVPRPRAWLLSGPGLGLSSASSREGIPSTLGPQRRSGPGSGVSGWPRALRSAGVEPPRVGFGGGVSASENFFFFFTFLLSFFVSFLTYFLSFFFSFIGNENIKKTGKSRRTRSGGVISGRGEGRCIGLGASRRRGPRATFRPWDFCSASLN